MEGIDLPAHMISTSDAVIEELLDASKYSGTDEQLFRDKFFACIAKLCNNESAVHSLFVGYIIELMTRPMQTDTPKFLKTLHQLVSSSSLLLNAFLQGLIEANGKLSNVSNSIHTTINESLPSLDWSKIAHPESFLQVEAPVQSGPLARCILDIIFSDSDPAAIANSPYSMTSLSSVSLLSTKSIQNFADGLILHYKGDCKSFIDILLSKDVPAIIDAIFRTRKDYSIVYETLADHNSFDFAESLSVLFKHYQLGKSIGFIEGTVIPFADELPEDFLKQIFGNDYFPSNNINIELIFKNSKCMESLSIKAVIEFMKRGADLSFLLQSDYMKNH